MVEEPKLKRVKREQREVVPPSLSLPKRKSKLKWKKRRELDKKWRKLDFRRKKKKD